MAYIKLNEVLALLKPSKLPLIRQEYSKIVAEGVLTKERLKYYFDSLPGKSTFNTTNYTNDIKDYSTMSLRSNVIIEPGTANTKPINSTDMNLALSELLPMVSEKEKDFLKMMIIIILFNSSHTSK